MRHVRLAIWLAAASLTSGCAASMDPGGGRSGSPGLGSRSDASVDADGWTALFDGQRVTGLRGYGMTAFPADRWAIEQGRLRTVPGPGIDLVTEATYRDFEVEFRWAVAAGGNSGVIYRVEETEAPAWQTGPEYQLLDDAGHADGLDPTTSAGALYDLIAPSPAKRLAPVGEVNDGRIVVKGGRVEHWLNGELILGYAWDGEEVRALIADSKFRELPGFMAADEGRVAFQHHGEEAWFTSIRIRSR